MTNNEIYEKMQTLLIEFEKYAMLLDMPPEEKKLCCDLYILTWKLTLKEAIEKDKK